MNAPCCGVFVIDALDAEAIEQVFFAFVGPFRADLAASTSWPSDTGQVSVVGQLADPHGRAGTEMSARPAVDGVAVCVTARDWRRGAGGQVAGGTALFGGRSMGIG